MQTKASEHAFTMYIMSARWVPLYWKENINKYLHIMHYLIQNKVLWYSAYWNGNLQPTSTEWDKYITDAYISIHLDDSLYQIDKQCWMDLYPMCKYRSDLLRIR